ncbi:DUF393 domain-containing protein [Bacillus thuringiensis]|nr:DUF393 domain-containing protein [Bacillus thuringiensis]
MTYQTEMDIFNLITFTSFRNYTDTKKEFGVPLNLLEQRMHSKKLNEQKYVAGIDSIIQICKRTPLLWVFLIVLYLGKFSGVGQLVYDFIAKRRLTTFPKEFSFLKRVKGVAQR